MKWAKAFQFAWQPVASALLLLVCFPPFHLWFLAPIALVPWYAKSIELFNEKPKSSFYSGLIFGFFFMLGQLVFIFILTKNWTGSAGLALIPWLLAAAIGSLYFGLLGLLQRLGRRLWLFPVLWCLIEILRSYLPVLAFPWGLLGSPLWRVTPALAIAHFSSIFGLGFTLACVSAALAGILKNRKAKHRVIAPIGTVAIILAISIILRTPVTGSAQRVSIGQIGVDSAFLDPRLAALETSASIDRLVKDLPEGTQLFVLPEGVADAPNKVPLGITIPSGICTIVGCHRGTQPIYQSTFSSEGGWHYADKTRLVIFGEFVPGRDWIPFLSSFNLPTGDISAGKEVQTVPGPGYKIGPLVCFEALFPDIGTRQAGNGAHLLTILSDDDFFMGSNAPEQLLGATAFRSAETGLPALRSAVTGYSAAFDADGSLTSVLPLKVSRNLNVTVQIPSRSNVVWPFGLLSGVGLVFILGFATDRRFGTKLES